MNTLIHERGPGLGDSPPTVRRTIRMAWSGLGGALLLLCSGGCSGGSSSAGPQEPEEPSQPPQVAEDAAVRFLTRATYGPTPADVAQVVAQGYAAWLDQQLAEPPSLLVPEHRAFGCAPEFPDQSWDDCFPYEPDRHTVLRYELMWRNAVFGRDQLKQRVAFAWSEILVVSERNDEVSEYPVALSDYFDTLVQLGSTGNFRELLEAVTLHPTMGTYLSMAGNRKEDPVLGTRPDENFAREVMQLFSIGLVELNLDGTPRLDDQGQTIPTYDQAIIEDMARALTGWTYATDYGPNDELEDFLEPHPELGPMEAWPAFHDVLPKILVGGTPVPGGMTAEQDLAAVLDLLADHPNVGPYLGRQLIQRLVTSNPTPEYVARVATVWNDDGQGTRGNLEAVIRAILLDPEALQGYQTLPTTFGKVREPILRMTALWRAFEAPQGGIEMAYEQDFVFGQGFLRAPSVFNFFSPNFTLAGLQEQGLVAPEMQITTHSGITRTNNFLQYMIWGNNDVTVDDEFVNPPIQLAPLRAAAQDAGALIDAIDLRLLGGTLSAEARAELVTYLELIPYEDDEAPDGHFRAVDALSLIALSPEYNVQK